MKSNLRCNPNACIILWLFFIVIVLHSDSNCQTDTLRVPVDTLYFDNYVAIQNKLLLEENWWEYEWELWFAKEKILTSPSYYPVVSLQNLSCYSNTPNDSCHSRDITGDGKGEIVIEIPSGGNNGACDVFIYSLDTTATLIGKFDGLNKIYGSLKDIDGDGIPEITFYDLRYDCWPEGCSGAPKPMLIWKWTGDEYKLANFKFDNHLLSIGGWKDLPDIRKTVDSWVKAFYGKPGYAPFPPAIAHVVLEYIYAGKFAEADSAFQDLWPPRVKGEDRYKEEIWNRVKSSPFWNELQESDW